MPTVRQLDSDYKYAKRIGEGGFGDVFVALHVPTNKPRAIKLLQDSSNLKRFELEAAILMELDHPNIVKCYEIGLFQGQYCLALEYIEGPSLEKILKEQGALSAAVVMELMALVADAMSHAHKHGIIHRDLKPANIVVVNKEANLTAPRVIDFGIARDLNAPLNMTSGAIGTLLYMPPEQFENKPSMIGPWTDVYSLGATMYALLTNKPPFDANSLRELLDLILSSEPTFPSHIPSGLAQLCRDCLEKAPGNRPQTCAEVRDRLHELIPREGKSGSLLDWLEKVLEKYVDLKKGKLGK